MMAAFGNLADGQWRFGVQRLRLVLPGLHKETSCDPVGLPLQRKPAHKVTDVPQPPGIMPRTTLLKPGHKAIKAYYEALAVYRERHVKHEGALETAFGRLLNDTAKLQGWTLIPKEKL